MNIFTCDGSGKTYQEAAARAVDNFITIYKLKKIKEENLVSVTPVVVDSGLELTVSLWVLTKGES